MAGADDTMMRPLYLELRHVRQAAHFLAAPKTRLTPEDISSQLCPALNAQQIYRLATTYWDDMPPPPPPAPAAAAPAPAKQQAGAEGGQEGEVEAAPAAVHAHAAPPSSPEPDMVSGEVLEALKASSREGGGGVVGNGGLIVTFLLDDDTAPIIAPGGSTAPEVLALVESAHQSPSLYGPMALPPCLDTADIPRQVFAWVEGEIPSPLPPTAAGGSAAAGAATQGQHGGKL